MARLLPALRLWLGTLLLSTLLPGCSEAPPPLSPLSEDAVILAFGDSLTYGSGVEAEQSYPAVLERLTGRTVINAGVRGELSAEGLERLPEALEAHRPELLVLCHGGNDLLRKRDRGRLKDNLRQMVALARSRGVEVVLLGVPKPKLFLLESEALYAELAGELALPYDGEVLPRLEADEEMKSDPIHLNTAGYRRLAGAVAELLRSAGAI